tara:strand:- start:12 stop:1412 length:1401 start_codon:yes stop_codon:yes gene_type:complete
MYLLSLGEHVCDTCHAKFRMAHTLKYYSCIGGLWLISGVPAYWVPRYFGADIVVAGISFWVVGLSVMFPLDRIIDNSWRGTRPLQIPGQYAKDGGSGIPLEFRGDGKSYFRISIVNLFLSIITLGIYSAWAKVRSNRYIYSHLYFDGTCFEYLANPLNILLGRAIAVVLFVSYTLTSRYVPGLTNWFLLLLIPVIPWIMLKSLQFRARNSAFRNIRFRFHGTYLASVLATGIYPALVLAPFVLYATWAEGVTEAGIEISAYAFSAIAYAIAAFGIPACFLGLALHRYYSYVVSNSGYGKTRFAFVSGVGPYYGILGKLLLALLLLIILIGGLSGVMEAIAIPATVGMAVFVASLIAAYVFLIATFMSRTTNLLYNGMVVPGRYTLTFDSRVSAWGLFKVYFVNTVFILLTLGLYLPFAKIRLIRYRISVLQFKSTRDLDEFDFDNDEDVAAMGQEMGDMFDLGVSL